MMTMKLGARFVTRGTNAFNDSGTGLPETWERRNGCVIVPPGTGGVVIKVGIGRGVRGVRFDGCEDHRSFALHVSNLGAT